MKRFLILQILGYELNILKVFSHKVIHPTQLETSTRPSVPPAEEKVNL